MDFDVGENRSIQGKNHHIQVGNHHTYNLYQSQGWNWSSSSEKSVRVNHYPICTINLMIETYPNFLPVFTHSQRDRSGNHDESIHWDLNRNWEYPQKITHQNIPIHHTFPRSFAWRSHSMYADFDCLNNSILCSFDVYRLSLMKIKSPYFSFVWR